MTLELYGPAFSQPLRAVRWLLEIKDHPFELINMNPIWPESKKVKYRAEINPMARVPSIRDADGFVLYESGAILSYLCNKYGWSDYYPGMAEPLVKPAEFVRRTLIDQYTQWHHENTRCLTLGYVGPLVRVDVRKGGWNIKYVRQRRKLGYLSVKVLDSSSKHLGAGQLFLIDDRPSIADLMAFQELEQCVLLGLAPWIERDFKNVAKWMQRMRQLPHYDRVVRQPVLRLKKFIDKRLKETAELQAKAKL